MTRFARFQRQESGQHVRDDRSWSPGTLSENLLVEARCFAAPGFPFPEAAG